MPCYTQERKKQQQTSMKIQRVAWTAELVIVFQSCIFFGGRFRETNKESGMSCCFFLCASSVDRSFGLVD